MRLETIGMMSSDPIIDGERLLQSGHREEAISLFRAAAELVPSDVRAHHFLAFALAMSGRVSEAERHFESALAISPLDATIWFNLGNAQRELSGGRAEHSFRRALTISPQWAEAYINLGVSLRDDMAGALDSYSHALALQPANAMALCNIVHAATWLAHWRGRDAYLHELRTRLETADRDEDDELLRFAQPCQVLAYPFHLPPTSLGLPSPPHFPWCHVAGPRLPIPRRARPACRNRTRSNGTRGAGPCAGSHAAADRHAAEAAACGRLSRV